MWSSATLVDRPQLTGGESGSIVVLALAVGAAQPMAPMTPLAPFAARPRLPATRAYSSQATARTGDPLEPGTGSGSAEKCTRLPTIDSRFPSPSRM